MPLFSIFCSGRFQEPVENVNVAVPSIVLKSYSELSRNDPISGSQDGTSRNFIDKFLSETQHETISNDVDEQAWVEEMMNFFSSYPVGNRDAPVSRSTSLVSSVLRRKDSQPSRIIDHERYLRLLLNPKFTPAVLAKVSQDMSAPMAHYYVYTGHNSYLKGNQLTSQSSIKPIIKSLLRGVRVIELDLWPNDKKTEILVTHGGTLTKPAKFLECIEAVRDNAFKASPYPVILTLEDHLPNSLQLVAAEVIENTLQDLLWKPSQDVPMTEFPSPSDLKGRIIISTQYPKADKTLSAKSSFKKTTITSDRSSMSREGSLELSSAEKEGLNLRSVPGQKLSPLSTVDSLKLSNSVADIQKGEEAAVSSPNTNTLPIPINEMVKFSVETNAESPSSSPESGHHLVKFQELTSSYRQMITIAGGRMKGETPRVSLREGEEVKRVSLSESQLANMIKSNPEDLIRFTKRNILRIYPTGMRVDSSNYKPTPGWTHGAQLVALNMQGYGSPLWQVHGFFLGNGACGYIKKPEYLISKKSEEQEEGKEASLDTWSPKFPGAVKKILKVQVVLGSGWLETFGEGYFDRFSAPDFYIKISVSGIPADKASKKLAVKNNSWTPSWEEEILEFQLTAPELAILKVKVLEYDRSKADDFAGQVVLPIGFLREGFRCVPLFDKKGWPLRMKVKNSDNFHKSDFEGDPGEDDASKRHRVDQESNGPRLLFHFSWEDPAE